MTAHEHEDERVIQLARGAHRAENRTDGVIRQWTCRLCFAATTGAFAAEMIGEATSRDLNQPGSWIFRHTAAWPLERSGGERFLSR